ncbi:MAG: hypothetical protein ACFFER_19185, partial [Candidatus Thorarchaeota archaeon]
DTDDGLEAFIIIIAIGAIVSFVTLSSRRPYIVVLTLLFIGFFLISDLALVSRISLGVGGTEYYGDGTKAFGQFRPSMAMWTSSVDYSTGEPKQVIQPSIPLTTPVSGATMAEGSVYQRLVERIRNYRILRLFSQLKVRISDAILGSSENARLVEQYGRTFAQTGMVPILYEGQQAVYDGYELVVFTASGQRLSEHISIEPWRIRDAIRVDYITGSILAVELGLRLLATVSGLTLGTLDGLVLGNDVITISGIAFAAAAAASVAGFLRRERQRIQLVEVKAEEMIDAISAEYREIAEWASSLVESDGTVEKWVIEKVKTTVGPEVWESRFREVVQFKSAYELMLRGELGVGESLSVFGFLRSLESAVHQVTPMIETAIGGLQSDFLNRVADGLFFVADDRSYTRFKRTNAVFSHFMNLFSILQSAANAWKGTSTTAQSEMHSEIARIISDSDVRGLAEWVESEQGGRFLEAVFERGKHTFEDVSMSLEPREGYQMLVDRYFECIESIGDGHLGLDTPDTKTRMVEQLVETMRLAQSSLEQLGKQDLYMRIMIGAGIEPRVWIGDSVDQLTVYKITLGQEACEEKRGYLTINGDRIGRPILLDLIFNRGTQTGRTSSILYLGDYIWDVVKGVFDEYGVVDYPSTYKWILENRLTGMTVWRESGFSKPGDSQWVLNPEFAHNMDNTWSIEDPLTQAVMVLGMFSGGSEVATFQDTASLNLNYAVGVLLTDSSTIRMPVPSAFTEGAESISRQLGVMADLPRDIGFFWSVPESFDSIVIDWWSPASNTKLSVFREMFSAFKYFMDGKYSHGRTLSNWEIRYVGTDISDFPTTAELNKFLADGLPYPGDLDPFLEPFVIKRGNKNFDVVPKDPVDAFINRIENGLMRLLLRDAARVLEQLRDASSIDLNAFIRPNLKNPIVKSTYDRRPSSDYGEITPIILLFDGLIEALEIYGFRVVDTKGIKNEKLVR